MPESDTGVRDRDHYHAARQLAPPVVRLHRNPAPGARVLHNILTRLRKRHSESHGRLRIESQLRAEDRGRALLNRAHDGLGIRRRELVERAVVELRGYFDQTRHATESLPIRWSRKPVAP